MSRVNILGEALDGLGRWYVAVPPFLIISFLAALFFLTGAGQAAAATSRAGACSSPRLASSPSMSCNRRSPDRSAPSAASC